MASKKPAANKRATLPRASDDTDDTKNLLKDWQHLPHSGRYAMNRLKEAMTLLIANDGHCRLNGSITRYETSTTRPGSKPRFRSSGA